MIRRGTEEEAGAEIADIVEVGAPNANLGVPIIPPATTTLPLAIPYGFARKFGVALLRAEDGHLAVGLREGEDPRVLIEVRRFMVKPFDVQNSSLSMIGFVT